MALDMNYDHLPHRPRVIRVRLDDPPYGRFVMVLQDIDRIRPNGSIVVDIGSTVTDDSINNALISIYEKYLKLLKDSSKDGESDG